MATKIQFRRGSAAQWTTANPVLAIGEPGIENDTQRFKVGDGVTDWNSLPYVYMAATGGDANETTKGFVEEATTAETLAGTAVGGTGAKLFVTPAKLLNAIGGLSEDRVAVVISGSTLTLDCNSYRQRNFDLTSDSVFCLHHCPGKHHKPDQGQADFKGDRDHCHHHASSSGHGFI